MSAAPLLRADHVRRRFGSLLAVDDVTMRVAPGEVVGLLGANGAGKTTLIRMLLGLLATSGGTVALLGGPPDRARRRRLGYVPQGLGLYRDLTIRENLAFSSGAYGVPEPTLPASLIPIADRLVGEVALGFQRQVAFLAALSHRPEVLVLDEPTSGVDPLAAASLWDTVHVQAERGVGVLVTTHNMQEAQQCDRLLLMSGGGLVAQGSEADLIAGTTALEVRSPDWKRAFAALEDVDLPVMLSGRTVRVANGEPDAVRAALERAGVPGELVPVPATIEERMAVLAAAASADAGA